MVDYAMASMGGGGSEKFVTMGVAFGSGSKDTLLVGYGFSLPVYYFTLRQLNM